MTRMSCAFALMSLLAIAPVYAADDSVQGSLSAEAFFSTLGNQIIGLHNQPVRLDCVGYDQPTSSSAADIEANIVNMIQQNGFNCLRFPWYDMTLPSDLVIMRTIDKMATKHGMKVIFDHHGNENKDLPYPDNGLAYDFGRGTDNTDGSGNTGHVSRARFIRDWVRIAEEFKGHTAVIGFDLTNEPHLSPYNGNSRTATHDAGGSSWGDGGFNDIRKLYEDVGYAIQQKNPDVLIICEGVLNKTATLFNMQPQIIHSYPDLTGVISAPVRLTINPSKLVYSVHDYPSAITEVMPDHGSTKLRAMNANWGFIVTQKKAPVWIGEMGASLDRYGADTQTNANLANERAWAAQLVGTQSAPGYLNGGFQYQNGPAFSGCDQGISTDWWRWGHHGIGEAPDGTLDENNKARVAQKAVTDQLLFLPKSGC